MPPTSNDLFYSRLPVNEIVLNDLLTEDHLFYGVPDNWHVIITDIEKSTKAVSSGIHTNVNLVATGCMVAVLNIANKAGITVPSFFGGDGATFIIPPTMLEATMRALLTHQANTLKNFSLNLRVGHISVADIYSKGFVLLISKLRTSRLFITPVILGHGLAYAEKLVKDKDYIPPTLSSNESDLDLSGMQCRWDTVQPPQTDDEVVSLLVIAGQGIKQSEAFKKVFDLLDTIYGTQEKRKPISVPRLRLKGTIQKLALEMRTKFGKYKPFYLAKVWMTSLVAPYYFKTKKGKSYLDQLVDLSDTLVIDGKINTVISGTTKQREELVKALDIMENEGLIVYGLHVSKESVLSCYVHSLDESHIHFVDGAGGGYTNAAAMMKKKLK